MRVTHTHTRTCVCTCVRVRHRYIYLFIVTNRDRERVESRFFSKNQEFKNVTENVTGCDKLEDELKFIKKLNDLKMSQNFSAL